jgi:hypothetical protein
MIPSGEMLCRVAYILAGGRSQDIYIKLIHMSLFALCSDHEFSYARLTVKETARLGCQACKS